MLYFNCWISLPFLISGCSTSADNCHPPFESSILLEGSPPGSKINGWPKSLFNQSCWRLEALSQHRELGLIPSALGKLPNSLCKTCRGNIHIYVVVINWFFRILARLVLLVTRKHFIWLLIQRTQYRNYWSKTINMKWYRSRYFNIKHFSIQWFFIIFPCFSMLKKVDWTSTNSR